MTNKEKYQRTFGTLHASDDFLTEVTHMNAKKHFSSRRLVCLCAAVILIFGLATVAYATDLGGIRKTIQFWLRGEQIEAEWQAQDGSYTISYTDANGTVHERGGGGVAIDDDGSERPLTEEELLEEVMNASPEVEYNESDGVETVMLYYRDQVIDITDKFDEDGYYFITLDENGHPLYVTVKYHGPLCSSSTSYVQPWEIERDIEEVAPEPTTESK